MQGFVVAGGDTAYPLSLALQGELHKAVVERAAAAFTVHHLHFHEHHIGPVGLGALRILDGMHPQGIGLARCLQTVAAAIGSHCLQQPRLVSHAVEGEQILILPLSLAQ